MTEGLQADHWWFLTWRWYRASRSDPDYLCFLCSWLMRPYKQNCLFLHLQSEVNGFADFHLYVCAAFLKRFSVDVLKEEDFQVRTDQLQKYFQERLVAINFFRIKICMLTHVHTYMHKHTCIHMYTFMHTHSHTHVCGGMHPVRRGGQQSIA